MKVSLVYDGCCCIGSEAAATGEPHCAACHIGLHSTPYAYLVIDSPRMVAYFDLDAANAHARAAGAVLAALPIVADYRPDPAAVKASGTFADAIKTGEITFPVAVGEVAELPELPDEVDTPRPLPGPRVEPRPIADPALDPDATQPIPA